MSFKIISWVKSTYFCPIQIIIILKFESKPVTVDSKYLFLLQLTNTVPAYRKYLGNCTLRAVYMKNKTEYFNSKNKWIRSSTFTFHLILGVRSSCRTVPSNLSLKEFHISWIWSFVLIFSHRLGRNFLRGKSS